MLKVLLKKQLMELFKSYFYDAKNNKKLNKTQTILKFVLFAGVIFGLVGGMFYGLSSSIASIIDIGYDWLYLAIMSTISIMLGVFASVFNSYTSLYLSKDNDLLLSMPIPVSKIIIARLLTVYVLGFMYAGTAIIPAIIVYFMHAGFSTYRLIACIILVLIITIFVLLLSCLLGFVVAKISTKTKNKSYITTAISLIFFGLYYYFYFKAQSVISQFTTNLLTKSIEIKGVYYLVYLFGSIGTGNVLSIVIFVGVVGLLAFITFIVLKNTFLHIAISTGIQEKHIYKNTKTKQKSIFKALLSKEIKRFTSSSVYMLNCGFGLLFVVVAGVGILIKKEAVLLTLNEVFKVYPDAFPLLVFAVLMAVISTVDIVVPSISLEGKNLWIVKSLPVNTWTYINAKLALQFVIVIIPLVFTCLCTIYGFCNLGPIIYLVVISTILVFVCNTLFGMYLSIKTPNFNWTNEMYPIKQSVSILIALLVAIVIPLGITVLYLVRLYTLMNALNYLLIVDAIFIVISVVLYIWLKTKGVRLIESM